MPSRSLQLTLHCVLAKAVLGTLVTLAPRSAWSDLGVRPGCGRAHLCGFQLLRLWQFVVVPQETHTHTVQIRQHSKTQKKTLDVNLISLLIQKTDVHRGQMFRLSTKDNRLFYLRGPLLRGLLSGPRLHGRHESACETPGRQLYRVLHPPTCLGSWAGLGVCPRTLDSRPDSGTGHR